MPISSKHTPPMVTLYHRYLWPDFAENLIRLRVPQRTYGDEEHSNFVDAIAEDRVGHEQCYDDGWIQLPYEYTTNADRAVDLLFPNVNDPYECARRAIVCAHASTAHVRHYYITCLQYTIYPKHFSV